MENKKRISRELYDIKPAKIAQSFNGAGPQNYGNPPDYAAPESYQEPRRYEPEFYYAPQDAHYFLDTDKNINFPDEDFIKQEKYNLKKLFWTFGKLAATGIFIFIFGTLIYNGIKLKSSGLAKGHQAMADLKEAKSSLLELNFKESYAEFSRANQKLSEISSDLSGITGLVAKSARFVPFASKISSGSYLISAGKKISQAGALVSEIFYSLDNLKAGSDSGSSEIYLEIFKNSEEKIKIVSGLLEEAHNDLEYVNISDIPEENRNEVIELKNKLPEINAALIGFASKEHIFRDILGGNGPRKYLFLFQNNQEMRATGGFIGTYAILDIFEGRVRNFFIDGIFNPDGQLRERIVPPKPIQKISANWSLHDSNWFPDFPVSAEKAAWFFEKTGGPTVDGVITMTPTVMQKMLEATGPIEMPQYGVTVDSRNFIEKIQHEVETDYDKELNQPKKILSDLAPIVLDRMLNCSDYQKLIKALGIINDSLNEKHILIYSKNLEVETVLSEAGWSGEILPTAKDYISIINTNINGYKTDGIITENISHLAEVQPDGTIINTLVVERKHDGGDTPFEWWNKVNANYMRIYVPQGSNLISATGHTREFNASPLDYRMLGYKTDPQVRMEEDGAVYDEENGMAVYDDKDKTVFAGWTYVSPKETVRLEIKYSLPFKFSDSYSLLAQKQSGSLGSGFKSSVIIPGTSNIHWIFPENAQTESLPDGKIAVIMDTDLKTDKFLGFTVEK